MDEDFDAMKSDVSVKSEQEKTVKIEHNGEELNTCDICKKSFSKKATFMRHEHIQY